MYITSISDFASLMKTDRNKEIAHKIDDTKTNYSLEIKLEKGSFHVDAQYYYNGDTTETSIMVDAISSKIDSFSCSCPWCKQDNPCGHVGATFIKCTEIDKNEVPYFIDLLPEGNIYAAQYNTPFDLKYYRRSSLNNLSTQLIDAVKSNLDSLIIPPTEKIKLIPTFTLINSHFYTENLSLTFKIGTHKLYVVKHLYNLINDIDEKAFVEFGKDFSTYLNYEYFDEDSQKLIDFIIKYRRCITTSYLTPYRSMEFDSNMFQAIYHLIDNLDGDYGIELADDSTKCQLIFKPNEYGYELIFHPSDLAIKNGQSYDLDYPTIYKKTYHNPDQLTSLINYLNSGLNFINAKDLSTFYHLFLKDLTDDIELIDFPYDLLKRSSLEKIELYGDLNEHNELEITLHYVNEDGSKSYGFTQNKSYVEKNIIITEKFIKQHADFVNYEDHKAVFDMNKDSTFEFIKSGLDLLKNYCEIFVSENLRFTSSPKHYAMSLGVKVNAGLLEVDIDSQDIPLSELADVLKNYKKRKKFHRLKSGEILFLESNELQELENMFDQNHLSYDEIKNGKIKLPLYRSFQTDDYTNQLESIPVKRSESFNECIKNFKEGKQNFILSQAYQPILRSYQNEGVHWMALLQQYGFGGILADDMGLGKTLQVLALLESSKLNRPSLVVCPASLVLNWQDEIHKFSKQLKCVAIHGNVLTRKQMMADTKNANILITSYDYLRRDIEILKTTSYDYVILDEAQYIKNHNTKSAQCVKLLKAKHRLALTGTPIENSLAELWSIFDFLMPNYLFNYHYFRKTFETPIVKDGNPEVQKQLKKLVEPFILRRLKGQVLTELPDKIEQTISIELTNEENKLYLAHALQVSSSIENQMNQENFDHIQILAMLTRLRQLCCEPRVLFENIHEPSSKINACMEIIQTFKENNKKILVFSSFTSIFPFLIKELQKEKIKYHLLTGATDKVERRDLVQSFQTDDSTVFLISLKAGGTGLNLTAAEGVIHIDPWWNVSAQNQATDRSHRFGQTNVVQVYKLIAQNTIEEKIMLLQERKKDLADAFVENNEGTLTKLTPDELLSLFK